MRWDAQKEGDAEHRGELPLSLPGLVRTVTTPEFAGVTFHEVRSRSALNRVPGPSRLPFTWTINPYRGCSHACVYCFARRTHTYLDLDAGDDFDRQVIVKTNVVEVLTAELRRPSWNREPVALGTNTDPYQRAEGRYGLMPGVIGALAGSGTPFSILTKGTLMRRDLPLLAAVSRDVSVGLGVSIAVYDEALHRSVEPGAPGFRGRLDLVRAVRDAGLECGVMVAPVLPHLTDTEEHLEEAISQVAAAGASGATVFALHLRPGAREWFLSWLERERPDLVPVYRRLYARGTEASRTYRRWLEGRVRPILRRHGLGGAGMGVRETPRAGAPPPGPPAPAAPAPAAREQLTLL
jgi:DNA repair photolyase